MTEIVKLAGRDVAIGLKWTSNIGDDEKKTAKRVLAGTRGLRQAVVFTDPAGMTFVGYDEDSSKWLSVPSGAAWLALAQEDGSQGALVQRVSQDVYWVVAVGHHQVLFEVDYLLSARSAAEQIETLLLRVPDLDVLVGPDCEDVLQEASWQPKQEGTFDQFFSGQKPPRAAFPRQLVGVPRSVGLAVIVAIVVVVGVAVLLGIQAYQRKEAEEAARLLAAKEAAIALTEIDRERERRIVAAVQAALKQDTAITDPVLLLRSCRALVDRIGFQSLAGWQLVRVQCSGAKPRAELQFDLPSIAQGGVGDAGSLAGLRERMKVEGLKVSGSIGGRGDDGKLTIQMELPVRAALAQKEMLPEVEQVLNGWFSGVQRSFAAVNGRASWSAPKPRSIMYKDPAEEKTLKGRRDPAKAMKPVPADRSFKFGQVKINADDGYVLNSVVAALTERPWLTLETVRFDVNGEADVQVLIDIKYLVQ